MGEAKDVEFVPARAFRRRRWELRYTAVVDDDEVWRVEGLPSRRPSKSSSPAMLGRRCFDPRRIQTLRIVNGFVLEFVVSEREKKAPSKRERRASGSGRGGRRRRGCVIEAAQPAVSANWTQRETGSRRQASRQASRMWLQN